MSGVKAVWESLMLDTNRDFETVARSFLAEHPEIKHEWRTMDSFLDGGRTDLICVPGEPREVLASLRGKQIAIGTVAHDKDFETFGRTMSDAEVAQEAFDYFVELLKQAGMIGARLHD